MIFVLILVTQIYILRFENNIKIVVIYGHGRKIEKNHGKAQYLWFGE